MRVLFDELLFHVPRCTQWSQRSVQLVARIRPITLLIKCGGFDACFYLMGFYFMYQDARDDLNIACNLLHE